MESPPPGLRKLAHLFPLAKGSFSLQWLRGTRTQVGTILVSDEARAKEAEALKSRDPRTSEAFRFMVEKVPIGAVCHSDVPLAETFAIADYAEDATTLWHCAEGTGAENEGSQGRRERGGAPLRR